MMQKALHIKTTVLPGGRVEIVDHALREGEIVDVVVRSEPGSPRPSAVDILNSAPGQRVFETAQDIDRYLKAERLSWGR